MAGRNGIRSRRLRWVIVGCGAIAVYVLVAVLYGVSGRLSTSLDPAPEPPAGGVSVELVVQAVDAAEQRLRMLAEVELGSDLVAADGVSPRRDLELILSPVVGAQSVDLPEGAVLVSAPVEVVVEGSITAWPFDRYVVDPFVVIAAERDDDGEREALPTSVWLSGSVPGWTLSGVEVVDPVQQGAVRIEASRAPATVAFAVILLALLVALPCLALFVAITTFLGRRKVEATLTSWMAAMLFATVPLRTFLPGSPPVGSWVDYLVVLWVVFGLIAALVVYVTAWHRWGAPPDRAR